MKIICAVYCCLLCIFLHHIYCCILCIFAHHIYCCIYRCILCIAVYHISICTVYCCLLCIYVHHIWQCTAQCLCLCTTHNCTMSVSLYLCELCIYYEYDTLNATVYSVRPRSKSVKKCKENVWNHKVNLGVIFVKIA